VRCGSRKVDQKCVGRGWYETVFGRTEVVLWKGARRRCGRKKPREARRDHRIFEARSRGARVKETNGGDHHQSDL